MKLMCTSVDSFHWRYRNKIVSTVDTVNVLDEALGRGQNRIPDRGHICRRDPSVHFEIGTLIMTFGIWPHTKE